MKGYKDFIVKVETPNSDTIETKSGMRLHLDSRWNFKETSNTIAEVIEVPKGYEGPIKKGCNVLIDDTVLLQQIYNKGGKAESIFLVDKKQGLYKVDPSMIILYSHGEGTKWEGYENNLLLEKVKPEEKPQELKKVGSIFIPQQSKMKFEKPEYKVFVSNEEIKDLGVDEGDIVYVKELMTVDVFIRGVKYQWLRTNDILAKKAA